MLTSAACFFLSALLLLQVAGTPANAQAPAENKSAAELFTSADKNNDNLLSAEEYQALRGTSQQVHRDFIVFDLDADKSLTEAEFSSIPSVGGLKRGPMPDPFAQVVEQLLKSIAQQAAEKPDASDKVEFLTDRFLNAFQKVMNERPPAKIMADPDQDGIITLEEAKRFFEIQVSWVGANQGGSALYTMDINGSEPKQICQGMMPSWSADGKSLAYSHSSQGFSLWLTSLDGESRDGLANGWGAQLSPDGTRVAFNVGADIHSMELATDAITILLQGEDNPYRSVYWNSTWSRTENDCASRAFGPMQLRRSRQSRPLEKSRS